MSRRLVILGASARAAAGSARRAGFTPWSADLFADVDLQRLGTAVRVSDYPQGLIRAVATAPRADWLYTGGLENHPELVDRIAARRRLLGNRGAILRAVRDPVTLAETFGRAGIAAPEVVRDAAPLPRDGTWLRKPLDSCGGVGIEPYGPHSTEEPEQACGERGWCYQRRIRGRSISAVFVAAAGGAVLLGITRQLIGNRWQAPHPFQYAGSLGPLRLEAAMWDRIGRIGRVAAECFGLAGLFGVDLIEADAAAWPVEINPRFPASVEILERAGAVEAVGLHVAACRGGLLPDEVAMPIEGCHGKLIVYAGHDFVVGEAFAAFADRPMRAEPWPVMTDVPAVGTAIARGHPVATVHAQAATPAQVERVLRRRAAEVAREAGLS